ncbi:MAG: hypothetical protein Q8Q09_10220 [Deltaproteobacteria bacterium]|nr:hypothetical protein [Deltaproteobacteria bacterium]
MGKGDRRHSNKMRQRDSQRKLKARIKKRIVDAKDAAKAVVAKPEKKRAPRAKAAPAS